jgi:hypothetical protein
LFNVETEVPTAGLAKEMEEKFWSDLRERLGKLCVVAGRKSLEYKRMKPSALVKIKFIKGGINEIKNWNCNLLVWTISLVFSLFYSFLFL